jgi:hypothetical protein
LGFVVIERKRRVAARRFSQAKSLQAKSLQGGASC